MAEKQSKTNSTVVHVKTSCGEKTPQTGEWAKKPFNYGLFLKVLLAIAVVGILVFVIYIAVGHKRCTVSTTVPVPDNLTKTAPVVNAAAAQNGKMEDCLANSIKYSFAHFTFLPSNGAKAYRTNGVEFSFEEILKKIEDSASSLTEFNHEVAATSRIHYYLNIDRCRIGGGVQLEKEPHIRGPLVFAANQECSGVYFYSATTQRWVKYSSATDITCSRHGRTFCTAGASTPQQWLFSKPENKVTALEFDFDNLAAKFHKHNWNLKPLSLVDNQVMHYYVNMKTCFSSDLPSMTSSLLLAVDHQCSTSYVFDKDDSTWKRQGKTPLFCPWKNHTWCENGAGNNASVASFHFLASSDGKQVEVVGLQFTFVALLHKLQGLLTDEETVTELKTLDTTDTKYYLNLNRCENGGLARLVPPVVRGPLYFAVTNNCTKVHYFSSNGWKKYKSVSNISCK